MSEGDSLASARASHHPKDITNLDDTVLELFLAGLADSRPINLELTIIYNSVIKSQQ